MSYQRKTLGVFFASPFNFINNKILKGKVEQFMTFSFKNKTFGNLQGYKGNPDFSF